jgi:hypothetical protein
LMRKKRRGLNVYPRTSAHPGGPWISEQSSDASPSFCDYLPAG